MLNNTSQRPDATLLKLSQLHKTFLVVFSGRKTLLNMKKSRRAVRMSFSGLVEVHKQFDGLESSALVLPCQPPPPPGPPSPAAGHTPGRNPGQTPRCGEKHQPALSHTSHDSSSPVHTYFTSSLLTSNRSESKYWHTIWRPHERASLARLSLQRETS